MPSLIPRTSQLFRAIAKDRTLESIEEEDRSRADSSPPQVAQDTSAQQQLQREHHVSSPSTVVTNSLHTRLNSSQTRTNVLPRHSWRNDLQDLLVQNGGEVTPPTTPRASSRGLRTRTNSGRRNIIPIAEDNTAQVTPATPGQDLFRERDNVSYRAQRGPFVPLPLPTPPSSEAKRKRTAHEEAIFERKLRKTGHVPGSGTFMVPESSSDEEERGEIERLQEELHDARASHQVLVQENQCLMDKVEGLETKIGELQDGLAGMEGVVQKLFAVEDVDEREDKQEADFDDGKEIDEDYWPDQMDDDDEDGEDKGGHGLESLDPRLKRDLAQEVQDLLADHRSRFPKWSL